jgi:hypothetical protein
MPYGIMAARLQRILQRFGTSVLPERIDLSVLSDKYIQQIEDRLINDRESG